jgi:hypothetical protein
MHGPSAGLCSTGLCAEEVCNSLAVSSALSACVLREDSFQECELHLKHASQHALVHSKAHLCTQARL